MADEHEIEGSKTKLGTTTNTMNHEKKEAKKRISLSQHIFLKILCPHHIRMALQVNIYMWGCTLCLTKPVMGVVGSQVNPS